MNLNRQKADEAHPRSWIQPATEADSNQMQHSELRLLNWKESVKNDKSLQGSR